MYNYYYWNYPKWIIIRDKRESNLLNLQSFVLSKLGRYPIHSVKQAEILNQYLKFGKWNWQEFWLVF